MKKGQICAYAIWWIMGMGFYVFRNVRHICGNTNIETSQGHIFGVIVAKEEVAGSLTSASSMCFG